VDGDGIPPMVNFGEGFPYHVTGLIHDVYGAPSTNPEVTFKLISRLMKKIENNIDDIIDYEKLYTEDAETVVISFGSTARSVTRAVKILRNDNVKIGALRLKTIWPFPKTAINELPDSVKNIIVAEMNYGQLIETIEATSKGKFNIFGLNKFNGELISPDEVIDKVREVLNNA